MLIRDHKQSPPPSLEVTRARTCHNSWELSISGPRPLRFVFAFLSSEIASLTKIHTDSTLCLCENTHTEDETERLQAINWFKYGQGGISRGQGTVCDLAAAVCSFPSLAEENTTCLMRRKPRPNSYLDPLVTHPPCPLGATLLCNRCPSSRPSAAGC